MRVYDRFHRVAIELFLKIFVSANSLLFDARLWQLAINCVIRLLYVRLAKNLQIINSFGPLLIRVSIFKVHCLKIIELFITFYVSIFVKLWYSIKIKNYIDLFVLHFVTY